VARRYEGSLDVFLTPEQEMACKSDLTMGWIALATGEIRTHVVEGNHLNMFEEPQVRGLAEKLSARLERGAQS
jgi:hypothetical protein